MFVCIHSTRLGPAMGGTRLKTYDEPPHALEDGLRLAAGMTRKLAVLGLPCGGGKAVLAVPEIPTGDERRRLLERYGDLIESLGGSYVTGPDVNTREEDMDVIGGRTAHVFCRSVGNGGSGDPSVHTALGVFHGIRATLAHAFGCDDPAGRKVLVQGTGSVGAKLDAAAARRGSGRARQRRRRGAGARHRRRAGRSRHRARAGMRRLRTLRARRDAECASRSHGSAAASSPAAPTTSWRRPRTASDCAAPGSSTRPTT